MIELDKFNKLFIANWKLNGSISFVKTYLQQIQFKISENSKTSLIICSPFPYIINTKSKDFLLGAQDCSI